MEEIDRYRYKPLWWSVDELIFTYYIALYIFWDIRALPKFFEQRPSYPILLEVYIITNWVIPVEEFFQS